MVYNRRCGFDKHVKGDTLKGTRAFEVTSEPREIIPHPGYPRRVAVLEDRRFNLSKHLFCNTYYAKIVPFCLFLLKI